MLSESGFGLVTLTGNCAPQILANLCRFLERWTKARKNGSPNLAWIYTSTSRTEPSAEVLAAHGFGAESVFYIETPQPGRALAAVCAENFFHAIVYCAPASGAALQTARRWLSPAHRPLVAKGSELSPAAREKLVVFADEL